MSPLKKVLALFALLAGVAPAAVAQSTKPSGPAPAATNANAPAIDAAQLLEDVRALSADEMEGRGAGTPGGERARAYVVGRFKEAGLKPFGASYLQSFKFTPPRERVEREGANVVGYVRGTSQPERFIVVTAHYDHLGVHGGHVYNGADDNASGVAGLLAVARHFARRPPRHTIIFVAFDNEEGGGGGAKKFVAAPPVALKSIVLNVNLDMISRGDKGELYAVGAHHYPFLKPYLERVAAKSPVRLLQGHDDPALGQHNDWTFQSDQAAFHRAGVPFVYFGVEDHADYHKPTDDFARVPREFFTRAAETVLAAVVLFDAELGAGAPSATPPAAAATRFAALDNMRVHYADEGPRGRGGEAVVFVHGWTCDATFWRLQAPEFAKAARVITLDLPGHGLSDKPEGAAYTMRLFARAVDAVLADAGVSRAVLVGHSMGTPVVREFYRLRPEKVRALVFVDGALRGFAPKAVVEERVLAPLRAANYRDTMNAMAGGMLGRQMGAPLAEELKSRMASTPQHVVVGAAEGMTDESLWRPDPVRVPVLAVFAKSPAWPADNERFYRSLAANLDYRMWEGVGHFLMLERPREFNDALAGFLKRVNFPEK